MAARLGYPVAVAVAMVVAVLAMSGRAEGQSCVTALMVCQADLKSTYPSTACCEALRREVTTDLLCVCALFSPAVMQTYNVSTEQADALATACGVSNLNACATLPPSNSPTPPSVPPPPPATGDAGRARRIGAHGLISLVVFWRAMTA